MKINPKIAVTLVLALGVAIAAVVFIANPSPTNTAPEPVELVGYYKTGEGVIDANTRELVVEGEFTEAVANEGFLLTTNKEGTLSLTRIADKKTMKVDESNHAYQLKAIGKHFGYLQERGEDQFITFLDPETGTSSPLPTEKVITWDVLGSDITYHLYESTTLGFAKYDGNLGVTEKTEIDANIQTIGQMFSQDGKNYVWVVADETENVIYSTDTHMRVTEKFPVIQKAKEDSGTLAEVEGSYWVVTAPMEESDRLFSQVWDHQGEMVVNLGINGYTFTGGANEGNGYLYVPVTYTSGNTPDGLFLLNLEEQTTDFEDRVQVYVGK